MLIQCLMVQAFYGKNWGFPKGKVNHNEDPLDCAIREVKEETGYDCSHLISTQDFIEKEIRGTIIRLYIVAGVDVREKFVPTARNEIGKIEWFSIKELPAAKNGNFFMAAPFLRELKEWIKKRNKLLRPGGERRGSFNLDSIVTVPSSAMVTTGEPLPGNRLSKERKFWARHWDNIQLDWNTIWSEVDSELPS